MGATNIPWRGRMFSKPCIDNNCKTSLRGVLDTPNLSARSRSLSFCPGLRVVYRIQSRRQV